MKSKKGLSDAILCALVSVVLTVIGFTVIPPLLKKYTTKLYKSSLKKDEIDFDGMGPVIVKKETEDEK